MLEFCCGMPVRFVRASTIRCGRTSIRSARVHCSFTRSAWCHTRTRSGRREFSRTTDTVRRSFSNSVQVYCHRKAIHRIPFIWKGSVLKELKKNTEGTKIHVENGRYNGVGGFVITVSGHFSVEVRWCMKNR